MVQPASLAQTDVRPTGDQEVTGKIHTGSGNIISIMKSFYGHSLLPLIQGHLPVSGERMHTILVNRGFSLPRKSVVR